MAAIILCKKIGLKAHRHQKRSTNYRSIKPTGFHLLKSDLHPGRPFSFSNSGIETDLDHRLQTLENRASQRYMNIYKTLSFEQLPQWLDRMLDQSVMPTLRRIGFDVPVSKALFEMALSSWKLLGPLNEKIIAFHPAINKEIEDVRQGLQLKACDSSNMIPRWPERPRIQPKTSIPGTINEDVFPKHLFDLFDEIGTPWIILPRASGFLKQHHCHYLPVYLKTIDQEFNVSCLKLFSRITVEFLGNYSLKFADKHHPPQKLAQLLFYGYSALSWKNFRNPPENLENGSAFDHFFTWIKRLARKSEFLGAAENNIIDQMMNLKTKVFPSRPAIRSSSKN